MFATAVEAVQEFYKQRMESEDPSFTADQLRFFVNNNVVGSGISPSSADRVLRNLRQRGTVDYVVMNRNKSLYRMVPLGTTHA